MPNLTLRLLCVVVAGVVLAGTFVRGDGPPTHDEAISTMAITGHQLGFQALRPGEVTRVEGIRASGLLDPQHGVKEVLKGLRETDVHPPLYFLFARCWLQFGHRIGSPLFSHEPAEIDRWLRLGSALLLVLGVLILGWPTRPTLVAAGALGAVLLLTLGRYGITQAANMRPYAMVLLWSCLTLRVLHDLFARASAERPLGVLTVVFGAALGLGLLTHYAFAPFALAALIGLLTSGSPPLRRASVRAALVAGLVFLPWVLYTGAHATSTPVHLGRGGVSITREVYEVGRMLSTYTGWNLEWLRHGLRYLLVAVWGVLVLAGALSRDGRCRAQAWLLFLPIAIPFAWDQLRGGSLIGYDRTAVAMVPVLGWRAGWLIAAVTRWPRLLGVALALLLLVPSARDTLQDTRHPWVEASQALDQQPASSLRPLVLFNASGRGFVLQRIRYLEAPADLLALGADHLTDVVPHLADRDRVLLMSTETPHVGEGLPPMTPEAFEALNEALRTNGFDLVVQAQPDRTGFALWTRRIPPR